MNLLKSLEKKNDTYQHFKHSASATGSFVVYDSKMTNRTVCLVFQGRDYGERMVSTSKT